MFSSALLDIAGQESEDEEDENPDERKPMRMMDRKIGCDEELSDSDDEGDNRRDNQNFKVCCVLCVVLLRVLM